ncbi:MAG: YidH family protein [Acidiferrobacter sp.]
MIERYGDHAANERTYLAWVRTGVAVMAFGFLVEKFDIFLIYIGKALHKKTGAHHGLQMAELLGIGLVALGILMMVSASIRFVRNRRAIMDETVARGVGNPAPYVAMVGALVLMGLTLLIYLMQVSGHP